MTAHTIICRATNGGWCELDWSEDVPHLAGVMPNSLASIIENVVAQRISGDFSFTDRTLDQLCDVPLPRRPEELALNPSASITLLVRESADPQSDMFNLVWRAPGSGLSCAGKGSRYRAPAISEQILTWFRVQRYESFGAPHPSESTGFNRVQRFGWPRELCLRRGPAWAARSLVPEAFPGPTATELRQRQDAIAAEYTERRLAKDPREIARRRQEYATAEIEFNAARNWCVKLERRIVELQDHPIANYHAKEIENTRAELAEWQRKRDERKQKLEALGVLQRLTPIHKIQPAPPAPPPEQPKLQSVKGGGWIESSAS